VDSSGSWGSADDFDKNAKHVAIELSKKFDDPDHTGVVEFSEMAKTVKNAEALHYVGGGTRISRGLVAAKDRVFQTGRQGAETLIFLITDATTTSYRFDLRQVSRDLRSTGARVVLLVVYPDDKIAPHKKNTKELQTILNIKNRDVIVESTSNMAKSAILATCSGIRNG